MDEGAVKAVVHNHKSLFAAGITRVFGDFGDTVSSNPTWFSQNRT